MADCSDRVLVMCATRNRPESFNRMVESVMKTSTHADIVAYIDDDQEAMYFKHDRRATVVVGQRGGQCGALNAIHSRYPGYLAYGSATDDCEYVTPGWDQWVIKVTGEFPAGIGAIAPKCEMDNRMDFPWLTANWLKVSESFCPLPTEHFFWDVGLEVVAEQVAIRYAKDEDFLIKHFDMAPTTEPDDRHQMTTQRSVRIYNMHKDGYEACAWIGLHRQEAIRKLKEAVARG